MTDFDTGWLVGFLEGEGCFLSGPPSAPRSTRIVAATTDLDVARKAAELMGCRTVSLGNKPRKPHHKQQYFVVRSGRPARDLMRRLRPHMGERRQRAIDRALASYTPLDRPFGRASLTFDQADEIRELLERGIGPTEAARRFGVSRDVVRAVRRGYRRPADEPALAQDRSQFGADA